MVAIIDDPSGSCNARVKNTASLPGIWDSNQRFHERKWCIFLILCFRKIVDILFLDACWLGWANTLQLLMKWFQSTIDFFKTRTITFKITFSEGNHLPHVCDLFWSVPEVKWSCQEAFVCVYTQHACLCMWIHINVNVDGCIIICVHVCI